MSAHHRTRTLLVMGHRTPEVHVGRGHVLRRFATIWSLLMATTLLPAIGHAARIDLLGSGRVRHVAAGAIVLVAC